MNKDKKPTKKQKLIFYLKLIAFGLYAYAHFTAPNPYYITYINLSVILLYIAFLIEL